MARKLRFSQAYIYTEKVAMQRQLNMVAGKRSGEPAWYQSYFLAMVEHDRNKALLEIEKARNAIRERTLELQHTPPSNPREVQDLVNALTYLGILLMHMGTEDGNLLWD
ncbi:MAG TPA: hypothetical protein VFA67_06275 [Candidatus Sulfotelmatobacter sp.]|nr:hypothetical protein [Candidatus Sulfotelmatobacter sp.]